MTVWVLITIPAAVTDKRTNQIYRSQWYHLTADDKDELHAFAKRIGLRRNRFQDEENGKWHYDITESRRKRAIAQGARIISVREMINLMNREGR